MPRRSRLARLLQLATVSQIALALGWLVARWPTSTWQALAGAALIMSIAPLALAVEFFLVWRVGASDPAPKPTVLQLLCAWTSETAHLFRTFYLRQPYRWRMVPDHLGPACAGRTGVVLVHGFMCNRGFWNAWMADLHGRGRAFVAVNLEPVFGSIDEYADLVEDAVVKVRECTGLPPLVVCHSMGGLAARAWWRRYGRAGAAAGLITIGTPHGGTWLARLSTRVNGRQMRLRSDWLRQLAGDESQRPLPPHACWYSNCDNVVFPASMAVLPLGEQRFVSGQAHVALAFHPDVRRAFLQWLERS